MKLDDIKLKIGEIDNVKGIMVLRLMICTFLLFVCGAIQALLGLMTRQIPDSGCNQFNVWENVENNTERESAG